MDAVSKLLWKVPQNPDHMVEEIEADLRAADYRSICDGISGLHTIYHLMACPRIDRAVDFPPEVKRAARQGEFDDALIDLLTHPNQTIAHEAHHDLEHSPTGLESLMRRLGQHTGNLPDTEAGRRKCMQAIFEAIQEGKIELSLQAIKSW